MNQIAGLFTLSEVEGSTLSEVEGSSLSEVEGSTLAHLSTSCFAELEGSTLSEVEGSTLSEVEGPRLVARYGTMPPNNQLRLPFLQFLRQFFVNLGTLGGIG
jgi:hypothetical protein